jgi:GLPGLI family protein
MFKNADDVKATLIFTNKESLYKIEDNLQNDGKSKLNMNRIFAGGDDIYYKNIEQQENYRKSSTFGELMLIEVESKKWQITQESKTIGNYLCYKAIDIASKNTKMKPIAWFTPLIPISFGPKEFSGLPGLILEIEIGKIIFKTTKIILNPKEKVIVKEPKGGKRLTYEEYSEIVGKAKKTVFGN